MKFTLSALKKYLITSASLDDIVEGLTQIGLEVEDVADESERLKDFIVADIEKAERHPDADRLQVCQVNTGTELLNIVCGGKNARAGIKVALARVGTVVPSFGEALKLGKIRGVESQGMLCSSSELLIDYPCPEHGIIEVLVDVPAGTLLAEALKLDDPVIDVAITPNRADCFSVLGIARDLAAYFKAQGVETSFKGLDVPLIQGFFEHAVAIENQAPEACYAFHSILIKGISNRESPPWLQQYLRSIGLRPISTLVDITNYSCMDIGRPLHVFDADKIQGNMTLRLSQEGESFDALDDKTYTLIDGMLVICDEEGIISLAGVMGGKRTGVTEETQNVLLESAWFNPVVIARAGQQLNLISDARMRFERGVDPELVLPGLLKAAQLIVDLCGGECSHPKGVVSHTYTPVTVELNFHKLEYMVGESLSSDLVCEVLSSLGCVIKSTTKDIIHVEAPSWRHDLRLDVDLVEEIVRLRGVDHIKLERLLPKQADVEAPPCVQRAIALTLTEYGYHEAVTFSFVDKACSDLFREKMEPIYLANPITEELTTLRTSHLPSLLKLAHQNQNRGQGSGAFFEVAPVYGRSLPNHQMMMASGLSYGKNHAAHWRDTAEDISIYDVKAHMMYVLSLFGVREATLQSDTTGAPSYYHPARSITYKQGNRVIAHLGQIHPKVMKHLDLTNASCGFEIVLDHLPPLKFKQSRAELSPYQSVERDFAFMVGSDFEAGRIMSILHTKLVRQSTFPKGVNLERVDLFDVYQSKESLQKSLAVRLRFEPLDRTLSDHDLEMIMQTVTTLIEKETGAQLRQ